MAFVVPNISESIKRLLFLLAIIVPVIVLAWVYNTVSKFQATLQETQRKQRICGVHALERETTRYVAYKLAEEEKDNFGLAFTIIGLIATGVCEAVGVYLLAIGMSTLNLQFALVGVAFLVTLAMTLLLVFNVSEFLQAKKEKKPRVLQEYGEALDAVKNMFGHLNTYLATNKNSTWENYRLVLAKRVARVNNLPSIEEAEQKVVSMLASDRDELIGYIEFDHERDYDIITRLAKPYIIPYTPLQKASSALEKLASPNTFDPLPAYQPRFDRMYIILSVSMTSVSLIWLILIRNRAGIEGIAIAFFLVVIMILVYSGMT